MKSIKFFYLLLCVLILQYGFTQTDLTKYSDIEQVYITSYWGNINVLGTTETSGSIFQVVAHHTDNKNHRTQLTDLSNFVTIKKKANTLYIATREPKGFESIDLALKIPEKLFVEIKLIKGGEIFVDNLKSGVEINSLNGSVKLNRISDYALVNAANGEVSAGFGRLDKTKPISLVTMNGGVTAQLPKSSQRDLRLISRKNGYVLSDFELDAPETITNLNKADYSKTPIINSAKINGGGALLFLSTENGPILIKKSKVQ